jgi:transposase
MAKRYELPDAAWKPIADLVSLKQKMGRPRRDDQRMFNGIPWGLVSGAACVTY